MVGMGRSEMSLLPSALQIKARDENLQYMRLIFGYTKKLSMRGFCVSVFPSSKLIEFFSYANEL
jgi:hypothetical protein